MKRIELIEDLDYSLEGIDFQHDSKLGKELEDELTNFRKYSVLTKAIIENSKIAEVIKNYTGMNVVVSTEEGDNAYVYVPDLDKNNVMSGWRANYYANVDSEALFKEQHFIDGTVNLTTGMVSGDFSKIIISICIGEDLLCKHSKMTVAEAAAILMHEIGHALVYFEMLGRLTKSNYILSEGVKRLMNANTKEQKILILEDIEETTGVKIPEKEQLVIKQKSQSAYRVIILSTLVKQSEQELNLNVYDARAFEQLADNFVSRHGYGKPLATGLNKLYKMYGDKAYLKPGVHIFYTIIRSVLFILHVVEQVLTLGPALAAVLLSMEILVVFLVAGNPMNADYDPIKMRITKIKLQINAALKDKSLSREQKQVYVDSHTEIEGLLDQMYNNKGIYEIVWEYVIPAGRKSKKVINLHETMENLLNNDLFKSAVELELQTK